MSVHLPRQRVILSLAPCLCRYPPSIARYASTATPQAPASEGSTTQTEPKNHSEKKQPKPPRPPRSNDPLPYPYGPRHWYKQSNRGLYGTLSIRSGNNVSERNKIKTRTKWRPNIQYKNIYSKALARHVKIRVATRVLRTIDKVGGLDEYLLGDKPGRIKELGPAGWALRAKLMRTEVVRRRFEEERVRLGLPREGIGMLGLVDERPPLLSKEELKAEEAEETDEEEEEEEEEEEDNDEEGEYLEAVHEVPEPKQQQDPVTVSRRRWNWKFWQR